MSSSPSHDLIPIDLGFLNDRARAEPASRINMKACILMLGYLPSSQAVYLLLASTNASWDLYSNWGRPMHLIGQFTINVAH